MSIPIKIKRKADGSIDNITFCPSITIEKQVWESTLNRSMVLEAENYKLKELLKECAELMDSTGTIAMHIDVYRQRKKDVLNKISQVLGE